MMAFLCLERRNNEASFMVLPGCGLRGLLESCEPSSNFLGHLVDLGSHSSNDHRLKMYGGSEEVRC